MWLLWWWWWWFFLFSADVTPITDLGKRVLFGWRLLWFCRCWGGCVGRYAHVCHVGRVCRQMHCSCGRSWWWPLRGRLLPALLWECIKVSQAARDGGELLLCRRPPRSGRVLVFWLWLPCPLLVLRVVSSCVARCAERLVVWLSCLSVGSQLFPAFGCPVRQTQRGIVAQR